MGAIHLLTPLPGPKSRALGDERRRWVSSGISEARHGLFVERTSGASVTDVDGNVLLDFTGGIGCLNAGHSSPAVVSRAAEQLSRFTHACFMTLPYEPYVALARELCNVAPVEAPAKAAFFNSGAEAVENAVKIARRATGRPAVLAFEPGFHGRTLLTMTMTTKVRPYKDGFGPFAPEVYRFPIPDVLRRPRELSEEAFVARGVAALDGFFAGTVSPSSIACAVFEPVTGEGGFTPLPRPFLEALSRVARDNGVLLVADEVQTGFGRTGRMFACEHFGLKADLVVLAKSMANGLPLSAVVGRASIMDTLQPGSLGGTFGGNPVACAAALGTLATLRSEALVARAETIGARVHARFRSFEARFPFVAGARGLGAMRAFELVTDRETLTPDKNRTERVIDGCAARGLLLLSAGLYGNVIRTLMPLVITDAELEEGLDALEAALARSDP